MVTNSRRSCTASVTIGDVEIILELSTYNAAIQTPTQNVERATTIVKKVLKEAAYLLNDPFGDKAQVTRQQRRALIDTILEQVGDTGVPLTCYEVSLWTLTTDDLRKIADNPQRFIEDVTHSSGNGQSRVRDALRNLRRPHPRR